MEILKNFVAFSEYMNFIKMRYEGEEHFLKNIANFLIGSVYVIGSVEILTYHFLNA